MQIYYNLLQFDLHDTANTPTSSTTTITNTTIKFFNTTVAMASDLNWFWHVHGLPY